MDNQAAEDQLLSPVKESNIDALVSAYVANLGISYLSLRYEKVEQLSETGPLPIRQMLDFVSESGQTPCDTIKDIVALEGKARYRISSYIRPLPPRKEPPLSLFKNEFPEDYLRLTSPDGLWQETTGVLPNTHSFAYALDSFAKWPAWLLLNTSGPLPELQGSDVNDPVRRLEGEQLGLRREMMAGLFPCKVIRFNQDLIKITRDQLVPGTPESISVEFEFGPRGYQYVSANHPTLEYALWGDDNKDLIKETIPLPMDSIKYGLRLPLKSEGTLGKEIRGSSLKLYLGKTLVDKMEGFYIRNIRIEIRAQ